VEDSLYLDSVINLVCDGSQADQSKNDVIIIGLSSEREQSDMYNELVSHFRIEDRLLTCFYFIAVTLPLHFFVVEHDLTLAVFVYK
jgi:hypothetical protein